MYVAFLDASKAFDRVNHTKLFSKLLYARSSQMDNQGTCSVVLQSVSVCKMGISIF